MLAHKAEEEGVFVAETCGQKPHINYNLIPGWFTHGQNMVGKQRNSLQTKGLPTAGQFPMRALGRSRASMDLDGFVKVLPIKQQTKSLVSI